MGRAGWSKYFILVYVNNAIVSDSRSRGCRVVADDIHAYIYCVVQDECGRFQSVGRIAYQLKSYMVLW